MESYTDRLRQLAPHYLVMVVLILVVLTAADMFFGELRFAYRLLLAAATAIAYPLLLRRLDRAPEPWQ